MDKTSSWGKLPRLQIPRDWMVSGCWAMVALDLVARGYCRILNVEAEGSATILV